MAVINVLDSKDSFLSQFYQREILLGKAYSIKLVKQLELKIFFLAQINKLPT